MLIHELTKRQRTDEGILDSVKGAVNSVKTGYNAAKGAASDIKTGFQQGGLKGGATAAGKVTGQAVNAYNAAGDRAQEKMWNKQQDKINKQAADAAKVLARKGFNVDTKTPLAQAQTPARIKQQQQQKISQLQQAFDREFDLKSGGQGPMATSADEGGIKVQIQQPGTTSPTTYTKDSSGVWTDETGQKITNPKSVAMLNAKADNPSGVQVTPAAKVAPIKPVASQPTVKEGALAQRSQTRNAGIARAPVNPTGKKDLQKEFSAWISQHIPGIQNVSPEVKQQLSRIFKAMVAAKGNPAAVDKAFNQYATIALGAIGQSQASQGQQSSMSPSAQYAQSQAVRSLGISPVAVAQLQQQVQRNGETIKNTSTGSRTMDTLLQAVAKK